MGYTFVVEYKKGIENKVVDARSRKLYPSLFSVAPYSFSSDSNLFQEGCKSTCLFLLSFLDPTWLDRFKASYQDDAEI